MTPARSHRTAHLARAQLERRAGRRRPEVVHEPGGRQRGLGNRHGLGVAARTHRREALPCVEAMARAHGLVGARRSEEDLLDPHAAGPPEELGVLGIKDRDLVVARLLARRGQDRADHRRGELGAHAPVAARQAEGQAVLHQQLLLDQAVEHAAAECLADGAVAPVGPHVGDAEQGTVADGAGGDAAGDDEPEQAGRRQQGEDAAGDRQVLVEQEQAGREDGRPERQGPRRGPRWPRQPPKFT